MSNNSEPNTKHTQNDQKTSDDPVQTKFSDRFYNFISTANEKYLVLKEKFDNKISKIKLDFEDILLIEIAYNFKCYTSSFSTSFTIF